MQEKIKLTLGQIAEPGFMTAVRKLRKQPLGKDAYAVGKSLRTIEAEFADYRETYEAIVKKHGKETSPGNWAVEVADVAAMAAASGELKDLSGHEFEIYLDHKIKLPDTGAIAEQLNRLSSTLMNGAVAAPPEQIFAAAQMLAGLVNEWWSLVLTPDDAMQLEPLITD